MNDIVINGLAIIGAVSCLNWVVKRVKSQTAEEQAEAAAAPPPQRAAAIVPATPANDAIPEHIAVIAAAVCAALGGNRIVHIEESGKDQRWAANGRWMHQTSHRPH